jgi:hypothetical protein
MPGQNITKERGQLALTDGTAFATSVVDTTFHTITISVAVVHRLPRLADATVRTAPRGVSITRFIASLAIIGPATPQAARGAAACPKKHCRQCGLRIAAGGGHRLEHLRDSGRIFFTRGSSRP